VRVLAPVWLGPATGCGTPAASDVLLSGHPVSAYFEVADTVETARDSGIWKAGYVYTTDGVGVHPSATGHAAMAAAINTALFA
jgi:hypothetical protein